MNLFGFHRNRFDFYQFLILLLRILNFFKSRLNLSLILNLYLWYNLGWLSYFCLNFGLIRQIILINFTFLLTYLLFLIIDNFCLCVPHITYWHVYDFNIFFRELFPQEHILISILALFKDSDDHFKMLLLFDPGQLLLITHIFLRFLIWSIRHERSPRRLKGWIRIPCVHVWFWSAGNEI